MTFVAIAKCRACGSETPIQAEVVVGGTLQSAAVIHEDDCPFFLAIEAGTVGFWIKVNGYPIEMLTPKTPVPG